MFDDELLSLARALGKALQAGNKKLAVAESCTGGLLAALLTEIAGSSEWFDCGIVSYSNQSKITNLGVQAQTLDAFGAVSEQTAAEMAHGALKRNSGDIAISITGIAGPGGGTAAKPVGTVCFGWIGADVQAGTSTEHFAGDRSQIRLQAVDTAIRKLMAALETSNLHIPDGPISQG